VSVIETLQQFHFAQPLWLVGLAVPLLLRWLPPARRALVDRVRLARYADPHLLPHLLKAAAVSQGPRRRLGLWSLLWALGLLAMAGPRWNYADVHVHGAGESLLVLLDISASMRATDVKPSRLARARQEVEDLLDRGPGLRVGVVAFASVAHVVAPITEDHETIRHLLPSLSPDLLRWQGSRVSSALDRAERLLSGQPAGTPHALVLVTDGDFAEEGLEARLAALHARGVTLHVLGIGTADGSQVPSAGGGVVTARDGRPVVSRLEESRLEALAKAGGGIYRRAEYRDGDNRDLLRALERAADIGEEREAVFRVWDEQFHLPLLAAALVLVLALRRVRPATVAGESAR
jgi:Ca-activated chloride channel family protein